MPSLHMAPPKSSTVTRVASSPLRCISSCSRKRGYKSAWTAKEEPLIIFLLSGCGLASGEIKYEHIYLHVYEDGLLLYKGLQYYFSFYNGERRHQSLGYETPLSLYSKAA